STRTPVEAARKQVDDLVARVGDNPELLGRGLGKMASGLIGAAGMGAVTPAAALIRGSAADYNYEIQSQLAASERERSPADKLSEALDALADQGREQTRIQQAMLDALKDG